MKKRSLLILAALCLVSFDAAAGNEMRKLDKKIAEIEQEYKKDIREIEAKTGFSEEMKKLRLKQKAEKRDLKIKQLKEKYDLKVQQKNERKTLKQKERQALSSQPAMPEQPQLPPASSN